MKDQAAQPAPVRVAPAKLLVKTGVRAGDIYLQMPRGSNS